MRPLKSSFGLVAALLPVLYCGGLVYYFLDLSGSVQEAEDLGLGPTAIGLGVVGLLFSIPLFLKIIRLFTRRSLPPDDDAPEDGDSVDPDAAIARYKARQSQEIASPPAKPAPAKPSPPKSSGQRPTFGRR